MAMLQILLNDIITCEEWRIFYNVVLMTIIIIIISDRIFDLLLLFVIRVTFYFYKWIAKWFFLLFVVYPDPVNRLFAMAKNWSCVLLEWKHSDHVHNKTFKVIYKPERALQTKVLTAFFYVHKSGEKYIAKLPNSREKSKRKIIYQMTKLKEQTFSR